jgi:hypothetical protein
MTIRRATEKSNVITLAVANPAKAAEFITRIWRSQPGEYFFLDHAEPDEKPTGGTSFSKHEFDKIEDFLRSHQGQNLWWCVHGFSKRRRKGEFAVKPKWLYADLDGVTIEKLALRPTIAIESSKDRYVGLWRVDDGGDFDLNKRVSYACAEDPSGWMKTKYLRVPFTINRKPGRGEPTVRVLWDRGERYTKAAVNEALGPWATLSNEAMLKLRKKYEGGSRSEHRAVIINQLVWDGLSDEEIFDRVWNTPWANDTRTSSKRRLIVFVMRSQRERARAARASPSV